MKVQIVVIIIYFIGISEDLIEILKGQTRQSCRNLVVEDGNLMISI